MPRWTFSMELSRKLHSGMSSRMLGLLEELGTVPFDSSFLGSTALLFQKNHVSFSRGFSMASWPSDALGSHSNSLCGVIDKHDMCC